MLINSLKTGYYLNQTPSAWPFYFSAFGLETKEIMKKAPQMVTTGALVRDTLKAL